MKYKIIVLALVLPQITWAISLSTQYKMGPLSSVEKTQLEDYKNLKAEYDKKNYDACYKRANKSSDSNFLNWISFKCFVGSSKVTEKLLIQSYNDLPQVIKNQSEAFYAKGLWALHQKNKLSQVSRKEFEEKVFLELPKKELAKYYNSLASQAVIDKDSKKAAGYYKKSLQAYSDRPLKKKLISEGIIEKTPVDEQALSEKKSIEKYLKLNKIKKALSLFSEYSKKHKGKSGFKSLQKKVSKGLYKFNKKNKLSGLESELSLNAPEDLSVWSYRMMKSHKCLEALYLAELGIKNSGTAISQKNYNAAYYSATNCKDYKKAYYWTQFWQKNTDKFSEEYKSALLKKGFAALRNKKWNETLSLYSELLDISESSKYRLPALYWSWRAAQQQSLVDKANQMSAQIIKEYPLTYYGLRAAIEARPNKTPKVFRTDKSKLKIKISADTNKKLRDITIASRAGWKPEPKSLLKNLLKFETAEEKLIESKLWSEMGSPIQAIKLSSEAWDLDPSLTYKDSVASVFPKKYMQTINKYSEAHKMNSFWVLSLIRQESAFQEKAKSSAGALGLMQLMPPTAREMGKRLRIKLRLPSSAWDPYINIRLGTKYLKQMLSSMDGHLPLALAAYNAGIGNIKKWKSQRDDVDAITKKLSSDPLEELWIEELHWSETRFYVKAILRNYIIYSLLYEKKPNFSKVLWQ